MTHGRTLLFQFVLVRFLLSKGQTCSFQETVGQKGMDSLRSNTGNMTADVAGCKTLCSTTELCIAGEFLSTTKTCHMYSLETSLTAQADTVFFQWNCNTGTVSDDGSTPVAVIVVGAIIGVVVVVGAVTAGVVLYKRSRKKRKTETELQEKAKVNEDTEKHSLTGDK